MQIEVPSPIDFHNRAEAEKWVADTVKNRPYRPRFFEEIAKEISCASRFL